MLHIHIIAVGKLKERFWREACDEYLKRLKPFARVELREVPDVDPARVGGEREATRSESAAICSELDKLPNNAITFLLDISGALVSSETIASELDEAAVSGNNDVCLIIGGSCGVDGQVRDRVPKLRRWSLGRITLPHNLARVVLLEQVYRAFKISRGEPYHK